MKKIAALVAFAALSIAPAARAYCPSYTPAQTAGTKNCGVEPAPGENPTTAVWNTIFAKVSGGSAAWGSEGPSVGTLGVGCKKPVPNHQEPARFPCHVLKAIAMQESGWKQFCKPDIPSGSVGAPVRTIVSFDCGYGIGQVTSGMHVGDKPDFDRARVASDATYNLATGTRILRDKWAYTKCVGDNDPDIVEDWYTAIWAYNGLAYSNNPNNPNLTAGRAPFNPKNGGKYTYQEQVLGWMEHPPSADHWSAVAVAYPNRGGIGGSGAPPELPEPECAGPTNCIDKRPTHKASCGEALPVSGGDAGADDASVAPDPSQIDAQVAPPPRSVAPPESSASPGGEGVEAGCSCSALGSSGLSRSPLALVVAVAAAIAAFERRRRSAG